MSSDELEGVGVLCTLQPIINKEKAPFFSFENKIFVGIIVIVIIIMLAAITYFIYKYVSDDKSEKADPGGKEIPEETPVKKTSQIQSIKKTPTTVKAKPTPAPAPAPVVPKSQPVSKPAPAPAPVQAIPVPAKIKTPALSERLQSVNASMESDDVLYAMKEQRRTLISEKVALEDKLQKCIDEEVEEDRKDQDTVAAYVESLPVKKAPEEELLDNLVDLSDNEEEVEEEEPPVETISRSKGIVESDSEEGLMAIADVLNYKNKK